jgi:hypothetical protein
MFTIDDFAHEDCPAPANGQWLYHSVSSVSEVVSNRPSMHAAQTEWNCASLHVSKGEVVDRHRATMAQVD